jgi:hypothetical protein
MPLFKVRATHVYEVEIEADTAEEATHAVNLIVIEGDGLEGDPQVTSEEWIVEDAEPQPIDINAGELVFQQPLHRGIWKQAGDSEAEQDTDPLTAAIEEDIEHFMTKKSAQKQARAIFLCPICEKYTTSDQNTPCVKCRMKGLSVASDEVPDPSVDSCPDSPDGKRHRWVKYMGKTLCWWCKKENKT